MSRFFKYGELPLVLLALIEREPLNGYELMGELGRLFGPVYEPSAGSVYPALSALETELLIVATGDEVPKRFALTKSGEASLAERRDKIAEIERRTGAFLAQNSIEGDLGRLVQSVREAAGRTDPEPIRKVLSRADKQVRALIDDGRTR